MPTRRLPQLSEPRHGHRKKNCRPLWVKFGRVVKHILPNKKWPAFARQFYTCNKSINIRSDSPEQVMRVVRLNRFNQISTGSVICVFLIE